MVRQSKPSCSRRVVCILLRKLPAKYVADNYATKDHTHSGMGDAKACFMGQFLTSDGGSISTTGVTKSSYGNYTTKNDCFLTWSVVMDASNPSPGDFHIEVGGTIIGSDSSSTYSNYAMNWFFYGFVKSGTTIRLVCPSKQYHLCKWKACEFSIVT